MPKFLFFFLFLSFLSWTDRNCFAGGSQPKNDTILAYEVVMRPVIDGDGDDECWMNSSWQLVNNVWLPWGDKMDSSDFYGRYKTVWSSIENRIYILLEIQDDTYSDAYIPGKTAEIFNFDMFEIFIDEDRSGGYHVFDGGGTVDSVFGLNAENAFGYHILSKFTEGKSGLDQTYIEDMSGTCWDSVISPDYHHHFPEFVGRRNGNLTVWELSLKVYNDSYDPSDTSDNYRVNLTEGKILGFTIAYNDDDDPEVDPLKAKRDNFIGSVAVSKEAWNDHWKNANDFGIIKLTGIYPVED